MKNLAVQLIDMMRVYSAVGSFEIYINALINSKMHSDIQSEETSADFARR